MAIIMAIDESGKPPDPVFALAGILIHESAVLRLTSMLDDLRFNFRIPLDAEFHAKDIAHGKGAFANIREFSKRTKIFESLLQLLDKIDATVVGVVGKGPAKDEKQALTQAFRFLIERGIIAFDKRSMKNELLFLIIDETDYRHDWTRSRLVEAEIESGFYTSRWTVTPRVVRRPIFLASKSFTPLQLADIVAYTIRRAHAVKVDRLGITSLYHRFIVPKLDKCRDGRVDGCGLKYFNIR